MAGRLFAVWYGRANSARKGFLPFFFGIVKGSKPGTIGIFPDRITTGYLRNGLGISPLKTLNANSASSMANILSMV